jgi:thiol-disulfide isomerase/thioredoxin
MHMIIILAVGATCVNFGPHVAGLTPTRFQREVDKRDNTTVWFVMFHGTHCPACQQAYPEFIRAAKEGVGLVKFGQVDSGSAYELASRFRIQSIPTFYIFSPGNERLWRDYPNSRTMLNAAARWIPDLATPVDDTWLADPELKAAILFTDKKKTPPIWAAISANFSRAGVRIGKSTNASFLGAYNVKKVPTILMIDADKRLTYKGKVGFLEVQKTIKEFFGGNFTETPTPTPTPTRTPRLQTRNLTNAEEFNRTCKGNGVFCVVMGADEVSPRLEAVAQKYKKDRVRFYACGKHCPLDYARKGVWIMHHKREAAIWLETDDGLESALDRVFDGGAYFKPLSALTSNSELYT